MPVLELECKSGVMAASYLLLLYGMAFSVIIFSDYYWQFKALVTLVLIVVATREVWRLFFYRQRPCGIRFVAQRWSLLINQDWYQPTDLALYYDWYFCLALRYRDRQDKQRVFFIWRETMPPSDWQKLRSYLYIYLNQQ